MSKGLEIRLASRPKGWPTSENFDIVEVDAPQPGDGELLIRNLWMSVDPYMRGRMNAGKSYVPPFVGKALQGGAVGEVVASNAEGFQPGDLVLHNFGWRDYAALEARHAVKVDPQAAPPSAYLYVLGMPGMTAYVGLVDVAEQKEGDVVFVSGAAGAVGSLVGQIAKLRGASRVIGSAGSAEKSATCWTRSASTPRSTTTRARSPSSSKQPRPTASTSTSTTSAASTSRPRSARSTTSAGLPSAA